MLHNSSSVSLKLICVLGTLERNYSSKIKFIWTALVMLGHFLIIQKTIEEEKGYGAAVGVTGARSGRDWE